MNKDELRPCLVKGHRHWFHLWVERKWLVDASPMVGGHPAGHCSVTMGLVENEHGQMKEVYPSEIRFLDREVETDE